MSVHSSSAATAPARDLTVTLWVLAAVLVLLPWLQLLPIDFDRTVGFFLLTPALVLGRRHLVAGFGIVLAGSRLALLLLGLGTFAALLATATAAQPAPAFVTLSSWILLGSSGLLVGTLVRAHPSATRILVGALVAGTALALLYVWSCWLGSGKQYLPLYAHHRHLGMHALLGAVAAVSLWLRPSEHRLIRLLERIAAAICWTAVFWSGGRMPLLALAASLALWWIHSPGQRRPIARASVWLLLLGLGFSTLLWPTDPALGWFHAVVRTGEAAGGGDISALTATRSDFWRASLQHGLLHPWLGYGPDAYRFLTPKMDGQQPHNLPLQLFLEIGVLGTAALLALLAFLLWRSWRSESASTESSAVWAAMLSAGVVGGMLDGLFYHALALLPLSIAIGVLLVAWSAASSRSMASVRLAVPAVCIALISAWMLLAMHVWIFRTQLVGPVPEPDSSVSRLVRAFPCATIGLGRWIANWAQVDPDAALDWALWAAKHSPNAAAFHHHAAALLAARGDQAAALAQIDAAIAKCHWTVRGQYQAARDKFAASISAQNTPPHSSTAP